VQEGGGAQGAYLEAIEPGTTAARRAELERSLREYCERDTLGMVRLAGAHGKRSVDVSADISPEPFSGHNAHIFTDSGGVEQRQPLGSR
jgi:hypothetical protein